MSNAPAKVFIKIESNAEQQENIRNNRKTFKILQRDALNKENLVGRPTLKGKSGFTKSKSEFDIKIDNPEFLKRKKADTKSAQTQTEAYITLNEKITITAEDLTTISNPGEKYFEILAEKRRTALDATLIENKNLHDRIDGLESELNTSKQMLDEAKGLVELLTEMLEQKENNEADACSKNLTINDSDINQGASTSGEASKYFDADSSESPININSFLSNDSDDE